MNLVVNGESRQIQEPATIHDLLCVLELEQQRVAVMVNGDIIRRQEHQNHRLEDGDAVDIVHMVGGG